MDAKLKMVLAETLGVDASAIDASTSAHTQPQWDSLRHMNIVFALEDAFEVRFRDEDIAEMTSVAKIEEALRKQQG